MKDVPEKIKESLERLKKAYGARLELRYLNKRFCVFEATSKWDPEQGKPRDGQRRPQHAPRWREEWREARDPHEHRQDEAVDAGAAGRGRDSLPRAPMTMTRRRQRYCRQRPSF